MKTYIRKAPTVFAILTATSVMLLFSSGFAWTHPGAVGGQSRTNSSWQGNASHSYGENHYRGDHHSFGPSGVDVTIMEPPPYFYYEADAYPSDITVVAPPSVTAVVEEPPTEVSIANATQAVSSEQQTASSDTLTIGVPNVKGGFTSVKLVKYGNGYIGPQGEFYAGHPSLDELKALYGG